MLNSHSRSSSQLNKELSYRKITTSVLHSKIMSTSYCISPGKYRKRFIGPRCYGLSNNGTPGSLKRYNDASESIHTSRSYNVNVSNCIYSKSLGYTGRLTLYNKEIFQDQQPSHQEKYGSPDVFPIVHLFKKNVPIVTPKPKQRILQIGIIELLLPDFKAQYLHDRNRSILEDIVRINNDRSGNEVSPRNSAVRIEPDVLKEIPRKRTHATEVNERDDSNKKLRGNCMMNGGDCSKRNRGDETTKSDACTSKVAKAAMQKLCTIDAVFASKTSSMYANYDKADIRKIIEDRKTMVSPLKKKKFNDADTKTVNEASLETISVSIESNEITRNLKEAADEQTQSSTVVEESTSPPVQVLRIFNDNHLEIIRKNRLRILLSALTGHEIPPIPMEDRRKALDQEWRPKTRDTEVNSILPSPDKPPTNSNKISEK